MLFTKIWQRYFAFEFLKTFLFTLIAFYGLYALIDYSTHSASFYRLPQMPAWKAAFIYYFCEFIKRQDVLVPFAALIATVRTLFTLNANFELVALLSSGIGLKRLMLPFLQIGLLLVLFSYASAEWIAPLALKEQRWIEETKSYEKRKKQQNGAIGHIAFEDGSTLIFKSYDARQKRFEHVFWVKSLNDFYRAKELYPNIEAGTFPSGKFVEHLVRDEKNNIVIEEQHAVFEFEGMRFNKKKLFETITAPEDLSLSDLWLRLPKGQLDLSEKESQIISVFFQKLMMPWLSLFAILSVMPFCLRFSRELPVFFVYAGSLFALIAFYLFLDSFILLGKRQVLDPLWLMWVPFLLFYSFALSGFARLRTG